MCTTFFSKILITLTTKSVATIIFINIQNKTFGAIFFVTIICCIILFDDTVKDLDTYSRKGC